MTTLSFLSNVQDEIHEVENRMRSQADGYHPDMGAALDLLLLSGGKRMRPATTLLTARMLGADPDLSMTIATAIELLHTATLVHDDLIDGSLLRRGSPTLNSRWSPGATVLTGDFLFARAAKVAAESNSVEVMKLFTNTLTTIVNGELDQLLSNHSTTDRSSYLERIYAKTASLFETSAASPALICNAGEVALDRLKQFGYNVGVAFQIIDDILDFTGQQATLGKPIGNDLHQGIITLPTILFIEDHSDDARARMLQMGSFDYSNGQVDLLIKSICESDSILKAHRVACDFVQKGIDALGVFPDIPERQALVELAKYIVSRRV